MKVWLWPRAVIFTVVVLLVYWLKVDGRSNAGQDSIALSTTSNRRQNNFYKHHKKHSSSDHSAFRANTKKIRDDIELPSRGKTAKKFITDDESRGQFPLYKRNAMQNDTHHKKKRITVKSNASKLPEGWNLNISEEAEDGLTKRSRNRVRLKSQRSHLATTQQKQSGFTAKINVTRSSGHRFSVKEEKRQEILGGNTNNVRPIKLYNSYTGETSEDGARLTENSDRFLTNLVEENTGLRAMTPTHFYARPVHKYLGPQHRFTKAPIHRYLSSPVVFKGANGENNAIVGEDVVGNKGLSVTGRQFGLESQPFFPGPPRHRPHVIVVNRPFHSPVPVPVPVPPKIVVLPHPIPLPPQRVPMPLMLPRPRPRPIFIIHHKVLSGPVIDPCAANPCRNGGTCTAVMYEYRCICPSGYKGEKCEVPSKCTPNPCKNFGKCTELPDDYECTCHPGFHGKSCEVESRCEPNPCKNGGVCTENVGAYVCSCNAGFMGQNCERESKCLPINPCKNGGVCTEDLGGYKCNCKDGYNGLNCEVSEARTACDSNPCRNAATCIASIYEGSKYTCYCTTGFTGINCDERTFPVVVVSNSACGPVNPCLFGGHCIPVGIEFTCACPSGRGGSRCEKTNLSQGSKCSGCHHHAVCLYSQCFCRPGFTGDGKTCRTKNPFCHPNPCLNGGTCREEGTEDPDKKEWWCECAKGYNGKYCNEYDPCTNFQCHNGGRCETVNNAPLCNCAEPYEGTNCLLDNACKPKDGVNRNPCKNGAKCEFDNKNGEITCICPTSYEGPTCSENKCDKCDKKHAFCENGICKCKPPYTGDGITCKEPENPKSRAPSKNPQQLANSCNPNQCLNNAQCIEGKSTFFCVCPPNTSGRLCEKKTTPTTAPPKAACHPNPCLNGGICKETGVNQDFDCICPNPRFKGRFCDVDMCAECDPHARCINGKCYCRRGYTGDGYTCKKVKPKRKNCPQYSTVISGDICLCNPGYYMSNAGKRTCIPTENSVRGLSPLQHPSKLEIPLPLDDAVARSGSQWSEDIIVTEYRSLGCWADTKEWKDTAKRALMVMEGLDPLLAGSYQERKQPISKCAEVAKRLGFRVFAIQNGGQCFGGADEVTYKTYGPSESCADGIGGPLANDVYKL